MKRRCAPWSRAPPLGFSGGCTSALTLDGARALRICGSLPPSWTLADTTSYVITRLPRCALTTWTVSTIRTRYSGSASSPRSVRVACHRASESSLSRPSASLLHSAAPACGREIASADNPRFCFPEPSATHLRRTLFARPFSYARRKCRCSVSFK